MTAAASECNALSCLDCAYTYQPGPLSAAHSRKMSSLSHELALCPCVDVSLCVNKKGPEPVIGQIYYCRSSEALAGRRGLYMLGKRCEVAQTGSVPTARVLFVRMCMLVCVCVSVWVSGQHLAHTPTDDVRA